LPCLRTIKRTLSHCGRVLWPLLPWLLLLSVPLLASMRETVKAWRLMSSALIGGGRRPCVAGRALVRALRASCVCPWAVCVA
jgi:hypothetical protein